ncbi:MAG TPA: DUF4349 domain-containing protein [Rhodothermales bacterium]|nr:DUF4349 domain-containing protein [Rhodothermales bacterium]
MSRALTLLLALALVAGCAQSADDNAVAEASYTTEGAPAPMPPAAPGMAADEARAAQGGGANTGAVGGATTPVAPTGSVVRLPDSTLGRRLLRTADVGLTVDDVAASRREVATITRRVGGFVGAETENRYGERTEVQLTIRVPAARFDEVLDALTADGDAVAYRNVRVEDVTDVMVDLEARLRARRAVLDRYLQLLARADEVGEILAVEAKVAETQESIEAAEGQLRGLGDRVSLATINVTVSDGDQGAIASGPPFLRRIGDAFGDGLEGMAGLAVGLVTLWPLWLIAAALFFGLRALLRRRRVSRASIPTAPVPVVPVPVAPAAS